MCAACKTPSWSGGAGLATAHLTSRAREWEPLVPGKRERRGRHPRPPERRRAPPKQPGALGGAPAPPAAGVRVHTGHAGAPQGEEGAGGVRFGPRGRRVPVARGSGGRSQTLVRGQHERRAGAGGRLNAEGGGRVVGRVAGRAAGDSERRAGAEPLRAPGFLPCGQHPPGAVRIVHRHSAPVSSDPAPHRPSRPPDRCSGPCAPDRSQHGAPAPARPLLPSPPALLRAPRPSSLLSTGSRTSRIAALPGVPAVLPTWRAVLRPERTVNAD